MPGHRRSFERMLGRVAQDYREVTKEKAMNQIGKDLTARDLWTAVGDQMAGGHYDVVREALRRLREIYRVRNGAGWPWPLTRA